MKLTNCFTSCFKTKLFLSRYGDGECLSPKDENIIVEKLLAYHPRVDDKIGCGLDAIMVSHYYDLLNYIQELYVVRNKINIQCLMVIDSNSVASSHFSLFTFS